MKIEQPEDLQPVRPWRQLRLVWHHGSRFLLRSCPGRCAVYVLVTLAAAAAALATPQVFGALLNRLQDEAPASGTTGAAGTVATFLAWVGLLLLASPLLGLCQQALGARIDKHIATGLQGEVFRRILGQPLSFFTENDAGAILLLLRDMCLDTQQMIRQLTIDSIMMIVALLSGLSLVLFNLARLAGEATPRWMWALIGLMTLAAFATPALVGRFGSHLRRSSTDLLGRNASLRSLARGGVQAPEEIKAFDAVGWFSRRQRDLLDQVGEARVRQTLAVERVNLVNSLPSNLAQVLLAGAALALVIHSGGSPAGAPDHRVGHLVALVLLVPQLMRPLLGLSALLIQLQSSWPSLERVFRVLDSPIEDTDDQVAEPAPTDRPPARLAIRDLGFRYAADGPPILRGAAVELQPGRVTGLVARMGEGKTTLFRLLMRFYDPQSGVIELDGRPLGEIPLSELRRDVTMMAQFPAFTDDTIADNLRLASPGATDAELVAACRQTGIWEILDRIFGGDGDDAGLLRHGFASGSRLSGGQKKLFALTRCLLRRPTLLLLDEPTTGMDNVEKFELIERLRAACRQRTVLVVDHDVRWLGAFCDELLVMERGRITARGSRDELLRGRNLFSELHETGEPAG